MMGAGTVGAAGLGLIPQNTRAAETDIDLREVNGSEKHKLVAIARQTDEYSVLSTHLKKKRDLVSTVSDVDVFEVRGEDGLDYQIMKTAH